MQLSQRPSLVFLKAFATPPVQVIDSMFGQWQRQCGDSPLAGGSDTEDPWARDIGAVNPLAGVGGVAAGGEIWLEVSEDLQGLAFQGEGNPTMR